MIEIMREKGEINYSINHFFRQGVQLTVSFSLCYYLYNMFTALLCCNWDWLIRDLVISAGCKIPVRSRDWSCIIQKLHYIAVQPACSWECRPVQYWFVCVCACKHGLLFGGWFFFRFFCVRRPCHQTLSPSEATNAAVRWSSTVPQSLVARSTLFGYFWRHFSVYMGQAWRMWSGVWSAYLHSQSDVWITIQSVWDACSDHNKPVLRWKMIVWSGVTESSCSITGDVDVCCASWSVELTVTVHMGMANIMQLSPTLLSSVAADPTSVPLLVI